MLGATVGRVELFGELLLILVETSRLGAHFGHFLGESVRGTLAKLLAQVVQLPAGSGAFGDGLGKAAFLECLGSLADVLAGLLHLCAGFGHSVPIFLALHPLSDLVGVAEDLLLLVPEPLELPFDLFARLLGLGGFEGRLQFLHPFVQVGLSLGQLVKPVEHLARSLAVLVPVAIGSLAEPGPCAVPRNGFHRSSAPVAGAGVATGCCRAAAALSLP